MFPVLLKEIEESERMKFAQRNQYVNSDVWIESVAVDEVNLCVNDKSNWSVYFGGRIPVNSTIFKTWSCLSKSGGFIVEVKGKLDSSNYEQLLEKHVSGMEFLKKPRLFLQDNFPVHLAPRVDCWLANKKGFNVLRLPRNSPDLMPLCKLHELFVRELNNQSIFISDCIWDDLSECFNRICQPHVCKSALSDLKKNY